MEYLQVKLKQGLKAAMAISSEGNIYLQVRIVIDSFGSYFLLRTSFSNSKISLQYLPLTIYEYRPFHADSTVLESLQGGQTFLQYRYENVSWTSISSSMFVRTIHAFFLTGGKYFYYKTTDFPHFY